MTTRRYHVNDAPAGAIYCGRGNGTPDVVGGIVLRIGREIPKGYFGNPHAVGSCYRCSLIAEAAVVHARGAAVDAFEHEFNRAIEENPTFRLHVESLRGKALTCWCAPLDRCHVDVYIRWLETNP